MTLRTSLIAACGASLWMLFTPANAAHIAVLHSSTGNGINSSFSGPDPSQAYAYSFSPLANIGGNQSGDFGVNMAAYNGGDFADGTYSASNNFIATGGVARFIPSIDAGSIGIDYTVFGGGTAVDNRSLYAAFEFRVFLNGSTIYEYTPSVSKNGGATGITFAGLDADKDFNMYLTDNGNPNHLGYAWDPLDLDLYLGTFNPGDIFNLSYEIQARVRKDAGGDFCGSFEGPNPVNCTELGYAEVHFSDPAGVQQNPLVSGATIAAVPVPAAIWLFGSGLLGLVGVARRKKAA